jgi:hypothetical protein
MSPVLIDLTPIEYRAMRVGKLRLATLCRGAALAVVFIAISMIWLHIYPSGLEESTLQNLQDEVIELEQRMQNYLHGKDAAQRALRQYAVVDIKRRLALSILDVVSDEARTGVSLAKMTIRLDEVVLEGAAQDAHALSGFLERVGHRCPRVQHFVDKMHATVAGNQSVESFTVRLRFSIELHGAQWCRDGDSHEG